MARTEGSKNIQTIVIAQVSRCPGCGSTEREAYSNPTEVESGGVTGDGHTYTHVVHRSTKCKQCGQARRDRTFENRPVEKPARKGI